MTDNGIVIVAQCTESTSNASKKRPSTIPPSSSTAPWTFFASAARMVSQIPSQPGVKDSKTFPACTRRCLKSGAPKSMALSIAYLSWHSQRQVRSLGFRVQGLGFARVEIFDLPLKQKHTRHHAPHRTKNIEPLKCHFTRRLTTFAVLTGMYEHELVELLQVPTELPTSKWQDLTSAIDDVSYVSCGIRQFCNRRIAQVLT